MRWIWLCVHPVDYGIAIAVPIAQNAVEWCGLDLCGPRAREKPVNVPSVPGVFLFHPVHSPCTRRFLIRPPGNTHASPLYEVRRRDIKGGSHE
jgi:hypothetical protein